MIPVGCEFVFRYLASSKLTSVFNRYVLWTDDDNRNLVERYYPDYLPTYDSLPKEIYRADMVSRLGYCVFG
jgi:mannosyltransferase OCH1-like enzyme